MPRHQDLLGKEIDEFRLERFIAAGAMGMVFEARDTVLNRTLAVKLIPKGRDDCSEKEPFENRAIREAQAAARLSHPNIVTVYRYGETADFHYIGMELVAGRTLGQILQERGKIPLPEALAIVDQVLQALESAAREQVVHRDIKPANIMVLPDGRVKVTDFGIAKIDFQTSTVSGNIMGTPSYMSPEQILGEKVDVRSDLFSLGAVFYQMVTGVRPFEGDNLGSLVHRILHGEPLPAQQVNPTLPTALGPLLHRALSKKPADRFASPREMRAALSALPGSREEGAGPRQLAAGLEETRRFPELKKTPGNKTLMAGSLIVLFLVLLVTAFWAGRRWLNPVPALPPSPGGLASPSTAPVPQAPAVSPSAAPPAPQTRIKPLPPPVKPVTRPPKSNTREPTPRIESAPVESTSPEPRTPAPSPPPQALPEWEAELVASSGEVFTKPGKTVKLLLRIRNSGTRTWRPAEVHYLGFGGWSGREGPLWRTVDPGTAIDFAETVVVPRKSGDYQYGVVLQAAGKVFSPRCYVRVYVKE